MHKIICVAHVFTQCISIESISKTKLCNKSDFHSVDHIYILHYCSKNVFSMNFDKCTIVSNMVSMSCVKTSGI